MGPGGERGISETDGFLRPVIAPCVAARAAPILRL